MVRVYRSRPVDFQLLRFAQLLSHQAHKVVFRHAAQPCVNFFHLFFPARFAALGRGLGDGVPALLGNLDFVPGFFSFCFRGLPRRLFLGGGEPSGPQWGNLVGAGAVGVKCNAHMLYTPH